MPDPLLDWQHAESTRRAATSGVGRRTETTRNQEPPTPIRVSIGRIEVHAPAPAAPAPNPIAPPRPPARTAITLDDYLTRREGRK